MPELAQRTVSRRSAYSILFILALSGFVTSFGAHVVAVNLPSYAEVVGIGAFMIGLLIAVYDFAELFAKPLAGFIADRRGMKRTLLVGLAIFVVSSLSYLTVPPQWLIGIRFLQGLGAAALSTISITLVAKYFETGKGRAFGIYNAIKGAGYVIAPPIGGFLVAAYSFAAIFVVSAAIGLLTLLLSLLLPSDRGGSDEIDDDDDDISIAQFFGIFREPRLVPAYAVILVNMFLVSILFGFLPVYLHSIDYTPVESGFVVSIATLAYLLVQPLAGHLADKLEIRVTVFVGLLVASVAIMVASFTSGIALLGVSVLAGLGVGTVWTNTDTLVSTLSEKRKLGASMGAAQSFKELGDMVGPLLVGGITQFFGVQVGFVSCGVMAVAVLALLAIRGRPVVRRKA